MWSSCMQGMRPDQMSRNHLVPKLGWPWGELVPVTCALFLNWNSSRQFYFKGLSRDEGEPSHSVPSSLLVSLSPPLHLVFSTLTPPPHTRTHAHVHTLFLPTLASTFFACPCLCAFLISPPSPLLSSLSLSEPEEWGWQVQGWEEEEKGRKVQRRKQQGLRFWKISWRLDLCGPLNRDIWEKSKWQTKIIVGLSIRKAVSCVPSVASAASCLWCIICNSVACSVENNVSWCCIQLKSACWPLSCVNRSWRTSCVSCRVSHSSNLPPAQLIVLFGSGSHSLLSQLKGTKLTLCCFLISKHCPTSHDLWFIVIQRVNAYFVGHYKVAKKNCKN